MLILSAEETRARLPYGAVVDALAQVLQDRRDRLAYAPARTGMPLPAGGVLLLMPATDGRLATTKLVTVHPENGERALPVVQADVLAMEAATGQRLALIDGGVVTARRTAALSVLAARVLAPNPAGPLLVVGAGTQARSHVEAFVDVLGVREIYVCSRGASAQELARYAATLASGVEARPVAQEELPSALQRAALVVTATTSTSPVLPAGAVGDGTFIAAVGAYTPQMAEIPADLVSRCRVYVDTLEGAQAEAGDLIQAGVDWARVIELQDALEAPAPVGASDPILFKSVGDALWDLAAARVVLG
jgi:1-piperideine-2-carboxylate/1-pyrroline-2-carboxylate reductase [NAD(P)H]